MARLLGATVRVEWEGRDHLRRLLAKPDGFVFAFFHGDLFLLTVLYPKASRSKAVNVMASRSRDGELLSRVLSRFGAKLVRGSSSRGAIHGLLELAKSLRRGETVAMAVDGPRGPRHEVKSGVVWLAMSERVALFPMVAIYHNAWRIHSWDRTEIPKPFSRCTIKLLEPIWLETGPPNEDPETHRRRLEEARRRLEDTLKAAKKD
ncbi:MAG: lysophospholipid acyltransferase family protein [bacterium]